MKMPILPYIANAGHGLATIVMTCGIVYVYLRLGDFE